MSTILINLQEKGSYRVEHQESGSVITTDTPPEFGGQGRSFSASDLLAAALGTCIATNLDSVAIRHGIPLNAFVITVEKELAQNPKRIASLRLTITFNVSIEAGVLLRLQNAAKDCMVKKSLHPDIQITTQFVQK